MPSSVTPFKVGDVEVSGGELFLIAGPCVVESEAHAMKMADAISRITRQLGVPYIFKASYDKANRTSATAHRGPGVEEGLRVLGRIRSEFGLPVLTDVHETAQVRAPAEVADILQIPAFLCRQADLIVEAARTNRAVNIKKGQFLAPHDMKNAVAKVASQNNPRVIITERGTSFGYNNLVVDFRGLGTATGGDAEFIEYMARAGVACGVDGVFMEVHDHPAAALSDGPNSLPLERLAPLLETLKAIHALVKDQL